MVVVSSCVSAAVMQLRWPCVGLAQAPCMQFQRGLESSPGTLPCPCAHLDCSNAEAGAAAMQRLAGLEWLCFGL